MSSGPIEFLSDEPDRSIPATQYGGASGLIQPAVVDGEEAHSELSASEVGQILGRAGSRALSPSEAWTGLPDDGEEVVDPVTGRVLEPDASEDVTGDGGTLSDLQP